MANILEVYKCDIIISLPYATNSSESILSFNLLMFDDYSVMGAYEINGENSYFAIGSCIPSVGFYFTLLNLKNKYNDPITVVVTKNPSEESDTYYGSATLKYPPNFLDLENYGVCVFSAVSINLTSQELENYIDQLSIIQDQLDLDTQSTTGATYYELFSEENVKKEITFIAKSCEIQNFSSISYKYKKLEDTLNKCKDVLDVASINVVTSNKNLIDVSHYCFNLITFKDYSSVGLIKKNSERIGFVHGNYLPNVGFYLSLLNLKYTNEQPLTLIATKHPNGKAKNYYGIEITKYPPERINKNADLNLCIIQPTSVNPSLTNLTQYLNEVEEIIKDQLEDNNYTTTGMAYGELNTTESTMNRLHYINLTFNNEQNEPLFASYKELEKTLK